MEIREEKRGKVAVVGVSGRIDASTAPDVEKMFVNLLDRGETRLVLDFSNLTYISSLGLRILVLLAKQIEKANGQLALAALNSHVHEVFKIAGFIAVFTVLPTCEEAVARLQSGNPS